MSASAQWTNIGTVFDGKAERWDAKGTDVAVTGDDCPLDRYVATRIRQGLCFIDLGSGDGKALRKLIHTWSDGTAILVDLSSAMLGKAAKEFTGGNGIRKVFVRANAIRTPLQDCRADFVVLRQLLQHVPIPNAVLREAARLVRPGGEVLVQVPGPAYLSDWDPFVAHPGDPIGRFSVQELEELFTSAGLRATVTQHRFAFTFRDVPHTLHFFGEVSLLDKLSGYHPNTTEIIEALLPQRMVRGLLSSHGSGQVTVGGEYLFGIGRK